MSSNQWAEIAKIGIPSSISLVAAIFAFLSYKRNRRLENENYIFKVKQENYSKILLELGLVIDEYHKYLAKLNRFIIREKSLHADEIDVIKDEIDAVANHIDDLTFAFDNVVTSNSLVFPKNIVENLDMLTDFLLDIDVPGADDENLKSNSEKIDEQFDNLIKYANDLIEIMRSDLNIEHLNISLYKRIRK